MKNNTIILFVWAVFICCVVVGSLAPAASPVVTLVGYLHLGDLALHFAAYFVLACLPVIGFRNRRQGAIAGLSMFFLGLFLEFGQSFSAGRLFEAADVMANGAGVGCGALFAFAANSAATCSRPWFPNE